MADNVKIQTKVQSFEDVQKSLQDIEKNFNKLVKAVNQSVEDERKETEGKSGDIQSINIGSDGGKDYSLQIKSKDGWQAPVLKPHYDSGWKDVTKNSTYTYKHNLGSKILLIQVYFKTDSHNIFNLSHTGIAEAWSAADLGAGQKDTGITIQMHNENTISIGTAYEYIASIYKVPFDDYGWESVADGYLRILIWKTGIIR
tara:strand:+ start:3882 stop:4481 length:600 start_codon:yes stop_codon:yes gene_type:complete